MGSSVSFTKTIDSEEKLRAHIESSRLKKATRETWVQPSLTVAKTETMDEYLAWMTATEEEKQATLKEISVGAYTAIGIPVALAEKLHVDWKSTLRECALYLSQAQFNFVISYNR